MLNSEYIHSWIFRTIHSGVPSIRGDRPRKMQHEIRRLCRRHRRLMKRVLEIRRFEAVIASIKSKFPKNIPSESRPSPTQMQNLPGILILRKPCAQISNFVLISGSKTSWICFLLNHALSADRRSRCRWWDFVRAAEGGGHWLVFVAGFGTAVEGLPVGWI